MKLEDPCPPGLNGAIGAAAGLLKAAIRSLNEFEDGLSATGGGPALGAAAVAGGDVAFAIAGAAAAGLGAAGGLAGAAGSSSGGVGSGKC